MNSIKNFILDETGVTAIEYGLIASLVSITIVAAASLIGKEIKETFAQISTALNYAQSLK